VDLHRDGDHHRSVITLLGEADELVADVESLARSTVERLDLGAHDGVHPRFGVVDVLPFVPLGSATMAQAVSLRDQTARWLADELAVPSFLYGPMPDGTTRTLPDVRRSAFVTLSPDLGPSAPHPTAGATAVGARDVLVAWNIWLAGVDLDEARLLAAQVRGPGVRTLGLEVDGAVQVSCNLVDPVQHTPAEVLDAVSGSLGPEGSVLRCELVGLAPAAVVEAVPEGRMAELGLSWEATIEAAAEARGLVVS
jgi:glutamate formiminotransferase